MKRVKGVTLTGNDFAYTVVQKLIQRLLKHLLTHLLIQACWSELLKAKKKLPFANPYGRTFHLPSSLEEYPGVDRLQTPIGIGPMTPCYQLLDLRRIHGTPLQKLFRPPQDGPKFTRKAVIPTRSME